MSQQINLFNPVFLKQKKQFSALAMAQALGVVLLGCALMVAYANLQLSQRTREAAVSAEQLIKAREQLIAVTTQFAPPKADAELDDEVAKAQKDVDAMQHVLDVVQNGEVGNAKGYANYFRAFARQIVDGLWLTGIDIDAGGKDIGLRGRTLNPELVPAYLTRLKKEPEIQGKSFSALSMETPVRSGSEGKDAGEGKGADAKSSPKLPAYIEFSLKSVDAVDAADGMAKAGAGTKPADAIVNAVGGGK